VEEDPSRSTHDWPQGFEGGLAHRLDVPTSGALLCADDPEELAEIRAAFASGAFTKVYRFVAGREVSWDHHVCDRPIAHHRRRRDRMVIQRGKDTAHRGRWYPAHTTFRRVEGPLFEAVIVTGVMHQIRVHAAFVGIALRGDRLYGGGAPDGDRPANAPFQLHHLGLSGAGFQTEPVPRPDWVTA